MLHISVYFPRKKTHHDWKKQGVSWLRISGFGLQSNNDSSKNKFLQPGFSCRKLKRWVFVENKTWHCVAKKRVCDKHT